MANARDLLRRKKSVQNTCKITRTMELVASAKMKKAQNAASASRPYAEALAGLVNRLADAAGEDVSHELMTQRPVKNVAVLIATSDRGLCGAYNGNIIRLAMKRIEELQNNGCTVRVVSLAKKVASTLIFFGHEVHTQHKGIMDAPSFEQARDIIEPLIAEFVAGTLDAVEVVYARFESAARIRPERTVILPVGVNTDAEADKKTAAGSSSSSSTTAASTASTAEAVDFLFHPDPMTLLDDLIPRAVKTTFFSTLLQTSAGEHAARRQAMKNATDAADDLIIDLNRDYNRARQGKITQEIAEIVGAVSAMA